MDTVGRKGGHGHFIDWVIHFGDLFLINVFFFIVFFGLHLGDELPYREKIIAFLLVNLGYFVVSTFIRFQISSNVIHLEKIVQRSTAFITIYAIFITAAFSIFHILSIPIIPWIIGFLILGGVFVGWHIVFRLMLKAYRRKGYNYRQVVIIGANANALMVYDSLVSSDFGYKVLGFFDDEIAPGIELPAKYLGNLSDIAEYAQIHKIDDIFCTIYGDKDELISELVLFSEKNMIRFHIVPQFYKFFRRKFSLQFIETTPVLSLRYEPLQNFSNRLLKRSFDVLFSGVFLITLFPIIYIILGAIIKLTSPGPVFFTQKRTGIKGKEFNCYKFRSMRPNKEANSRQAVKDDPRVTRIGAFMRKTSLDELPQFINVLKNDMSVVGPRPHMLQHTELYSSIIDKFMVRHLVKPGITGWAQVTGFRGETKTIEEMEGRVKKDVWYLENWTFFLDLKIIYLTIKNAIRGEKKAY
ncbi:undecaprenyl-phosphate glucose phosphotransferase [Dysgonomonas sp. Marseille-P4361]|uniref:undecaprenyl-phosphate glucose phosphotransferase n=1 Tax=Dysgonomonas sp. Marseille-P4361 TaxID=2161820 RepID=UPI000D5618A8|nr:undecaprenyl-phosphate glucose phosphotransferase [Dysgonomonas sp. Marseille-P4361]